MSLAVYVLALIAQPSSAAYVATNQHGAAELRISSPRGLELREFVAAARELIHEPIEMKLDESRASAARIALPGPIRFPTHRLPAIASWWLVHQRVAWVVRPGSEVSSHELLDLPKSASRPLAVIPRVASRSLADPDAAPREVVGVVVRLTAVRPSLARASLWPALLSGPTFFRVIVDDAGKQLVVRGPRQSLRRVVPLIEQIDRAAGNPGGTVAVAKLVHASAEEIAPILQEIMADRRERDLAEAGRIIPNTDLGVLLIGGDEQRVDEILELVAALDVPLVGR